MKLLVRQTDFNEIATPTAQRTGAFRLLSTLPSLLNSHLGHGGHAIE
jgi:hypothetical protein